MSSVPLRVRLVMVLAVVMAVPLLVAGVAVSLIVPAVSRQNATDLARQSATGATTLLGERCRLVSTAAASLADRLTTQQVQAAVEATLAAVPPTPGLSVVVLDSVGTVLAASGAPAPGSDVGSEASDQAARPCLPDDAPPPAGSAAATPGAESSQSEPSPAAAIAAAAQVPAPTGGAAAGAAASVVVWVRLDATAVDQARVALGVDTVAVLGADRRPLTTGGPAVPPGVLAAVTRGATVGDRDGHAFAVAAPSPQVPFAVVTVARVETGDLAVPLLLSAAAAGLLGALLVGFVAARLARPLAELDATHDALSDTFGRFGEALGHTHHLDGLLAAVVDAAVHGAAADAGAAWIVSPAASPTGGEDPDAAPPSPGHPDGECGATVLQERVATPGAPAGPLEPYARRAVQTEAEVRQVRAHGVPVVAAMPLREHSGRVVGVLAVARAAGSAAFGDEELDRVRALSSQAGTAVVNLRLHEETRLQSVTDPLTGVGNFRQLSSTLSKEVERASRYNRPLSVLMLDLDHFKQVNDTLGHAFGDFVLQEVARRLTGCLREGDTLARRGGEEFTVVLPETDTDGACVAATRILDAVRDEPFGLQGRLRVVTISVGVASFPAHGTTAAELLGSADTALYAAKDAGRNRWALANGPGSTLATTHAG